MKRLFIILIAGLFTVCAFSQAPQNISYQAVIRNSGNALVTSTTIGMQISILQGSASGTAVYVETQTPETNINGLVTIIIGEGTQVSTDAFADIDWSLGPYFIKTGTDPTGGTNYTAIVGTSPLLSVPYALYAKNAADFTETDPSVPTGTQTGEMQYWNGSAWITVTPGTTGQVLTFISGVPVWTTTAVGLGEVLNPTTGKIWMDKNLGALRVAGSSTDADAYGHLYQWGRGNDGHQIRTSVTTPVPSSTDAPGHSNFILAPGGDWRSPQNANLWQGVSGVNNPCPSGYRLPTEAEWNAEKASWSSNNDAGAFASTLKLPVAGARSGSNGSLYSVGSSGVYWSSTVSSNTSRYLTFSSSTASMSSYFRSEGISVRCLKD